MVLRSAWAMLALSLVVSMLPPAASAAAQVRAMLTLRVNTVSKFDVTAKLGDSDVFVMRKDLEDAGLQHLDYHGAKPDDYVSLQSLRPAVTYNVDDKALTLDLTVSTGN